MVAVAVSLTVEGTFKVIAVIDFLTLTALQSWRLVTLSVTQKVTVLRLAELPETTVIIPVEALIVATEGDFEE